MAPPTAWEVYQKHLFTLGYGWPLWDPSDPGEENLSIDIGSIIYSETPSHYDVLFNVMRFPEDTTPTDGYPEGFTPFPSNVPIFGPREHLKSSWLHSSSITSHGAEADIGGGSPAIPASASLGFKFVCKKDSGAMLYLASPAQLTHIQVKRHIVTYMRTHYDSWRALADERGFSAETDLWFVSGTLKTTRWFLASFQNSNYREKEGHVDFDLANLAKFKVSFSIANDQLTSAQYNYGPTLGRKSAAVVSSQASLQTDTCDQCLFIHYYKMKRRIFRKEPMQAAAGPHDLPPGADPPVDQPILAGNESSDGLDLDVEQFPPPEETKDPVEVLLDYILSHSEAEVAIACDRDITVLFQSTGIPFELKTALECLEPPPPIEVDEDGVGSIGVDIRYAEVSHPESVEHPTTTDDTLGPLFTQPPYPGNVSVVAQGERQAGAQVAPTDHPGSAPRQTEENNEGKELIEEEALRHGLSRQPIVWEPAANGHTGSVTSLAVSPDSKWLASGSEDTTIILWDTQDKSVVHKWVSHGDVVWNLAFSPDSQRLASAGGEGDIMIWDVQEGELLATLRGHTNGVQTAVWSPDGTKVVSASDDETVRVWDTATYEQIYLLEGHHAIVPFATFSPDGTMIVSCGAEGNCRIWDVEGGTLRHDLEGHEGMVWAAAFDPECRRVATASDSGSVRIWSTRTGEELVIIHEHYGPVWTVAFSHDGKQVMSASSDSTIKLCDSFTGEKMVAMEGHDSMVNSACFSPNGKYIASASSDNTVRLWKTEDGSSVCTFNDHGDKVTHVLFTPDGLTLSSGSDDGAVGIRVLSEWVRE